MKIGVNKMAKRFRVFWFDPKPTTGAEMDKVRPCVVVSPDMMNDSLRTVIVIPLTSTLQSWPFRQTINFNGQKTSVACDQIRAIDKSRLKHYIGDIKTEDQQRLLVSLQTLFS